MENYIVRVYRRDDQNPEDVIGMVERVERDDRQPFHSLSELCQILSLSQVEARHSDLHVPQEPSVTATPLSKNVRHR